MSPATNWTPGIIALSLAATVGVFVLLRSRSGAQLPAPERSRRDEVERQKTALYALLRDHATRGTDQDPAWVVERDRLELAAARVLRDLDEAGPPPQITPEPLPTARGWGDRNPRLAGAAWGAGIVLFLGALVLGVQEAAKPRAEGGSLTGGGGGMGGGGGGGGAAAEAPQALSPAQAARIASMRAAVEASPADIKARNELGHALLTVGKLMDSFKEAETVRKVAPDDPEARTHQAVVLLAIGDTKTAMTSLDSILVANPEFGEALAYRGALYLQSGDKEQALTLLERAAVADPRLAESLAPLVDEAKGVSARPRMAAPPETAAPAGAPSAEDISGTITLASGSVEPGQTIFILARAAGVDRGPPSWVTRLKTTSFPLQFSLGPANAMMPGATPEQLVITARVDTDGNAMTRGAGDLEGKSAAVAPGTTGVSVVLSPVQ